MAKASLTSLPAELRLQILSESTPCYHTTPARQSPSSPLHGANPLLLVSRQIRDEALTLRQPKSFTIVHVNDLDREIGRRKVEERDWFSKLMVIGIADEDGAKDVEAKLRECWTLVKRIEMPSECEDDCLESLSEKGATFYRGAACFNVRGACMCWSYYPVRSGSFALS